MKRPLFIAAVIVLSGIICGINESGYLMKAAAVFAAAAMLKYLLSEASFEDASLLLSDGRYRRLITVICVLLFAAGLARGATVSLFYNTGERRDFFAEYEPGNPGQFDYAMYLKSKGICSKELYEESRLGGKTTVSKVNMTAAGAETGDGEDKAPVEIMSESVKSYCGSIMDASLSTHDAGIYRAVLLGDKESIDGEVRDLYQAAGIAHLLAVSGLHVSMIGAGLYSLFRKRLKLKASVSAVTVSAALFLYMLITGAGASVVRAVIMFILGITAIVYGRNYCMTSALSLSAVVLAMLHPYLIFTSGFQLSFGAVAAISLVGQSVIHKTELLIENAHRGNEITLPDNEHMPQQGKTGVCRYDERTSRHEETAYRLNTASSRIGLKKHISRSSRLPKAASAFIISAAVQLVTLPIIAYHYYTFPVYGILLNFIVIPLMAAVLASALSVLAAGTVTDIMLRLIPEASPVLHQLMRLMKLITAAAAAPGHYILKLYEYLCSFSLKLPFASVCIGRPSVMQILIYYLLLAAAVSICLRTRCICRKRIFISLAALIMCTVMSSLVLRHYNAGEFETVVLDVGQGDCIYIRSRGTHILVDGGSSSRKNIGSRVIENFLLSEGVDRLDAVVVSHADNDHVNGIEYLLGDESRISIEKLVLPSAAENDEAYDKLKELCSGSFTETEKSRYVLSVGDETGMYHEGMSDEAGGTSDEAYSRQESTADRSYKSKIGSDSSIKISCPAAGEVIAAEEDFSLICMYPGTKGEDRNRQSLVLMLRKGTFSMLLTGDTTAEDERIFSSEAHTGRLTVLKAAHHGSKSSNSEELFESFRPLCVIVSCGRDNRYGHPHEEVLDRIEKYGAGLLRTDEGGAVTIRLKGDKADFEYFKYRNR